MYFFLRLAMHAPQRRALIRRELSDAPWQTQGAAAAVNIVRARSPAGHWS
ncbi:hypothetical protein [Kitasatospora sp. NPDC056531]